jgi:hypothetical protein
MRGTVKVARKEPGTISRVVLKVQQVFHKLDCNDIESIDDARFKYFTQKVRPLSSAVARSSCGCAHDTILMLDVS